MAWFKVLIKERYDYRQTNHITATVKKDNCKKSCRRNSMLHVIVLAPI
jgi:hypothetical protein